MRAISLEQLLFLDTETTGREEHDRIFQVAYFWRGKYESELVKPPVPLSIEAMEATHYTNDDVKDKPPFTESEVYKKLQNILQDESTILVAHNAPFDIAMLEKEGFKVKRFIDTLRLAQHLDPDAKLGAYRLQYLRYALVLDVKDAQAHDALGDVKVLQALFKRLFAKLQSKFEDESSALNEMLRLSAEPVEIKRFNFGKHKNKLVKDVAKESPDYLEWLLNQKLQDLQNNPNDTQTKDWVCTLKKYI